MIEGLPGGAAEGEVADQADGSIGKALADVDHPAMRVLVCLVGAFGWGIGDLCELDAGSLALQTGFVTAPLVALALAVEAIGIQGIAILANRASIVIVAAGGPLVLVLIGRMAAAVNDAPGMHMA